ncbi:MAG: glycogen/starch synthase, partial [Bacteriovoracaceae bacterium]|nr:glycogen/starch synthase [Bacteriovoracaceae bacterium]
MAKNNRGLAGQLVEISWEVCNPVGGIHTVIRSKTKTACDRWDDNYLLLGPWVHSDAEVEVLPLPLPDNAIGIALKQLQEAGFKVLYGRWQVAGHPQVVLFSLNELWPQLDEIKTRLWYDHHVPCGNISENLIEQTILFGHAVFNFLRRLEKAAPIEPLIAHFHEWMAGLPIPFLRREGSRIQTVFTTHATMLGRYLAMNDPEFYQHLPFYDWKAEAHNFNIEFQVYLERAAAHGAHHFTTVSEVTADECRHLLGRPFDFILPNGLDMGRFSVGHELQNLHRQCRDRLHEFVIGHFFSSYAFDLDKTLYFFTSGRFEYRNKGFDLTLAALDRLNWKMKLEKLDTTVVMFFITPRPCQSINAQVLQSQAIKANLAQEVRSIQKELGEKLFLDLATGHTGEIPDLQNFISDERRMALKRIIKVWKAKGGLPLICTHILYDDQHDDVLNYLRYHHLVNLAEDRVKIIYHPDFITPQSPLGVQDYQSFVRGCHLSLFPSYYEPGGYTPLESMACGVATAASDLSGFGRYVQSNFPGSEKKC